MPKILTIDNDPSARRLVKVNLENRGFIVDDVSDGTEAIRYLKQTQPDVVILDLVMPDIDGIDVCIWLRAQSDVPIIVLSAYDKEDLMIRALNAGADDYVTKPFLTGGSDCTAYRPFSDAHHGTYDPRPSGKLRLAISRSIWRPGGSS